ncbi:EscU/YscU/HrcU family type III secretion system export apparatus switch protein [Pseudolabrys sp. FHR47]|uniref:EscU/YscU/HrcU family type III secretion system export apparatus switch protein n=1 Tax=Pseudolabrys sp. FHR47 TaxID=2562284 RepID=UPI0010BE6C2E|nr:EscU/YscU/HrcU family type III secretion system export apparatus switch protein [Pseudolabrys sp. FHR47]
MSGQPPQKSPLAVALEYDHETAPRVTAVGQGDTAERMQEIARHHGVPLIENPQLAAALSKLPLDQEIPEQLYRAVAEVLSYILKTSGKLGATKG